MAATLPILLLSGILLPLSLAPPWLRRVAWVNPLIHIVTAERAVFNGHFADSAVVAGLLLSAALAVLFVTLASRKFAKDTA